MFVRKFIPLTVKRGTMLIPIDRILEVYTIGAQVMVKTDCNLYEPYENFETVCALINEATSR